MCRSIVSYIGFLMGRSIDSINWVAVGWVDIVIYRYNGTDQF